MDFGIPHLSNSLSVPLASVCFSPPMRPHIGAPFSKLPDGGIPRLSDWEFGVARSNAVHHLPPGRPQRHCCRPQLLLRRTQESQAEP